MLILPSRGHFHLSSSKRRWLIRLTALAIFAMAALFAGGKLYQHWDDDPDRGAIGITQSAFGETYTTPIYLDQGWDKADSLWYYNATQGSNLLPYDLFVELEQHNSKELFRSDANMDYYRYLPQKPTFFNPEGLPVGFAKDNYQGKDYMGFTCAACHTGQVNFQGQAMRIDGGPAMADMVGFLSGLEKALISTRDDPGKRERFIQRVLARNNDYRKAEQVSADLDRWSESIQLYNTLNHSKIDYGYARLDAFGRIYNRVLQHVLNRDQLHSLLLKVISPVGEPLLTTGQIDLVLADMDNTIIGDDEFRLIARRLQSKEPGFPGLSQRDMLRLRDQIFNEPNAPVSYPFLWDITHSDYVQWNGLAANAGVGPLGRNAGEVIGVFAQLDWEAREPEFSLSAYLTGQKNKQQQVSFKSSIDLINLQRLEAHVGKLRSPAWPEEILGSIDREKAARGERIYARYCGSCHQVIDPQAWDRLVVGRMGSLEMLGTDPAMAQNSVNYRGMAGNFTNTYQQTDAGVVVVEEWAPVVQILTSVTKGVVATTDADKNPIRRGLDWLYTLGLSFFDNDILPSIKAGNYNPDTTSRPYNSLLSYKARSLNGIWATAPYLHNGSVPSLYELLLPKRRPGDPEEGEYRPDEFQVGSREFDPVKVGFRTQGYEGFLFRASRRGDLNGGHEYGAGRTPQPDGKVLPALNEQQRWDLVEYLKTL